MGMSNTIIEQKRNELMTFIQREVVGEPAVQAVIAVGSVATGLARLGSDIDAVVFLDPFDPYAIPAEFQWRPEENSFHGIFVEIEGAIQFDFKRLDLAEWSQPAFEWPEPLRAELSAGWIAFDRHETVKVLIAERSAFTDMIRQARLDEALVQLDQLLADDKIQSSWETLGPIIAHDRLNAAYDQFVQALFAYNQHWRPWRSREISSLLQLPWLPEQFTDQVLTALNAPSLDHEGFMTRVTVLTRFFEEFMTRLIADGLYGQDAIGEAFIRQYNEPGRNWNIEEWTRIHHQRN
jgi:predicted nucleotidyltransferase